MGNFTHTNLNSRGSTEVMTVEYEFDRTWKVLELLLSPGREKALVRTKLQEASFWAKKAICELPENQI